MKNSFKFFMISLLLSSLLKAEEYSVDLYSKSGEGYWQMVGIGTLSEPPVVPEPPNSGNNLVERSGVGDSSDPVEGINIGTDPMVTLTNITGSGLSDVKLWIEEETYSRLKFFKGDPLDTMFVKLSDSTDGKSQLQIQFREPLNGAKFYVQYQKADGSMSEQFGGIFTHQSSFNEPVTIDIVSELDRDLTIEALQEKKAISDTVVEANSQANFPVTTELRVYKYDGEWHYYSNFNEAEQNDFTDFEGGFSYWIKMNAPTSGSSAEKVGKIELNDGHFRLDPSNIDTYSEYYKESLKDGWNLLTVPSSPIRNSISAVIAEFSLSGSGNTTATLEFTSGGIVTEAPLDSNATGIDKIVSTLNEKLIDTAVRVYRVEDSSANSDKKALIISRDSFKIKQTNPTSTVNLTSVKSLFSSDELLNSSTQIAESKIEGVGLLFKEGGNVATDVADHRELIFEGREVIGTPLYTGSEISRKDDVSYKAINSKTIINGSQDLNITIGSNKLSLITSKEEFSIKEAVAHRVYELDFEEIKSNWTDSDTSNDKNWSIYIGQTEVVVSNSASGGITSSSSNADIKSLIESLIVAKQSGAKVRFYSDNLADTKFDLHFVQTKGETTPLRAYDSPENSSMLLKPKNSSTGNLSGIYQLHSLTETDIYEDNSSYITSMPTVINSPTTATVSTELRPLYSSMSIINRAGFNIAKILTAETNIVDGSVEWKYVNLNVPDNQWFNNPDHQMELMSFNQNRGYWFYLQKKEADAEVVDIAEDDEVDTEVVDTAEADSSTEPTPLLQIAGVPSINFAFEHYYDSVNSVTDNVFKASATIQVAYRDETTQSRAEAYVVVAGKRFDFIKSRTGDEFSIDIHGFNVGELSNIEHFDIYVGDGRGEFLKQRVPLDKKRPLKPLLRVSDFNTSEGVLEIEDVPESEDKSYTAKFELYKKNINSFDGDTAISVEISEDEPVSKVDLSEIFTTFGVKLKDGETKFSVIALDSDNIRTSYASDIATVDIVALYCGSHQLSSELGVESSIPLRFGDSCVEEEEIVIENSGITLNSYQQEAVLYYAPIENAIINNSQIPKVMYVGLDGEVIGKIEFNRQYIGKNFYLLYGGDLYKGEFSEDHENAKDGVLYILKGGEGDEKSGKEIY